MIILEEDECTPLKGDSTTPVSPTSPSQLSSPDSPPSYNEAVVCNPFSRHPSYDAILIPESLNLESLDRASDTRRRRRNKHRVHMMLLFLALMGCIVFWLTFAIFFEPGGLARKGGRNPPPGPPPDGRKHRGPPPEEEENSRGPPDDEDGVGVSLRCTSASFVSNSNSIEVMAALLRRLMRVPMAMVHLPLQMTFTETLAASVVPSCNVCFDLTPAKPPEDREYQHILHNIVTFECKA
ncbi:hypothetical protein EDD85DRAFT_817623 [Armillaria nabsnona]|nr:hypothetical protein EDD85DRAFT_817623 [Armillaria nabsnona]